MTDGASLANPYGFIAIESQVIAFFHNKSETTIHRFLAANKLYGEIINAANFLDAL